MDLETMRSITDWLLFASVHQEPVPSHVTAAGSCTQVTRPGTTPLGTPNGERGLNKEDGSKLAAATDRANSRRVISILTYSSTKFYCYGLVRHARLIQLTDGGASTPAVNWQQPRRSEFSGRHFHFDLLLYKILSLCPGSTSPADPDE